jgi:NADPH:quinone reductase-like Zn-dependent oxidoreductase
MKAIVVYQYGPPDVLKYEDAPDPVAGPGEVLIRIAATSINPIDIERRSGAIRDLFPIQFPGIIGVDIAGTVEKVGPGVTSFSPGDKVFAMADRAYAQLAAVQSSILARIPEKLDHIESAALPLVTTTGHMLISDGAAVTAGQTVLILGAAGNVGRSAVYTAKQRGAKVIAGIRRAQFDQAASLGADELLATDDPQAIARLRQINAIADTIGGKTAAALLAKVSQGGIFATVLDAPANAGERPDIRIVAVQAHPDPAILLEMSRAVIDGKLTIPIARRFPLNEAAAAHALVERGSGGKVLLVP